jgi:predicted Fe-Mo cluster-binding NifX family protein
MIMACATNDGTNFVDSHFGDADKYYLYNLTAEGCTFLKIIENTTESEEEHADPKKAKGIVGLLKRHDVQIVVSKRFGPNIKRISRHFLPVILSAEHLVDDLVLLTTQYDEMVQTIEKGKIGFIRFKDDTVAFFPIRKDS